MIQGAGWIATGEGKLDARTFSGKVIAGRMPKGAAYRIPVIGLCGSLDLTDDAFYRQRLTSTEDGRLKN